MAFMVKVLFPLVIEVVGLMWIATCLTEGLIARKGARRV